LGEAFGGVRDAAANGVDWVGGGRVRLELDGFRRPEVTWDSKGGWGKGSR